MTPRDWNQHIAYQRFELDRLAVEWMYMDFMATWHMVRLLSRRPRA